MKDRSEFAATLVAAHHDQEPADAPPAALPTDYAEAMRVQREVTEALDAEVSGWKVGFAADGTPVAGPLYANVVRSAPATLALPERGYLVEIELAFRLARDLPAQAYTHDAILDAVDEALIGVELIRGRHGEPPAVPYFAFLADNLGNAGYITGDTMRDFRKLDLKALPLRFSINGQIVQEAIGGHPQGDPVEPLRAYASTPNDELGGLKAGQLITTGSLTKPLRLDGPARIEATLQGIGTVRLTLK